MIVHQISNVSDSKLAHHTQPVQSPQAALLPRILSEGGHKASGQIDRKATQPGCPGFNEGCQCGE